MQHILTKDIFLRVFGEDQFHRENNVAGRLEALEQTFFTGDVRRQAIDRLHTYYGAIGRAADEIADYAEKQQFLKAVYEDFYKSYNPAAADRLGVVATPPTRWWTSSSGEPTTCFKSTSTVHWPTGQRGRCLDPNRHGHLRHQPHQLPGREREPELEAWSASSRTPTRWLYCPTT